MCFNVQIKLLFRGFSEPKWALINTCPSCIARSRAMSCVTCFASGAGSTDNWPVFTGSRGQPDPTRPGDWASRTSRVRSFLTRLFQVLPKCLFDHSDCFIRVKRSLGAKRSP